MFTGLIETKGIVTHVEPVNGGARFEIYAPEFGRDMAIGDSVAVNGACLTIISFARGSFAVDVSLETLERSTLGKVRPNQHVNLERAMRLSDRLAGHLVSGHVDGVGTFAQRHISGNAVIYQFDLPEDTMNYVVEKGSISIDGISLTVARIRNNSIAVSVIPHTEEHTTLKDLKVGELVNIEVDMIAKYVRKFTTGNDGTSGSFDDFQANNRDEKLADKLKGFLER